MNANKPGYENEFQISDFRFQIKRKSLCICVYLWLISLCLLAFPSKNEAQVRPVYDYGAIGLGQLLKRLNNTKSVMHIGAHPDDEDSGLLAYLARGENARTAYLSLTRGDGGQNIIGNELGEALGVIRTEELLQARRLDGAEQYFTRAYDYGFSKTLDEAKQKWDEKIILCDAVRAIRQFRPLVVISRFSGTSADGHGQHQFAGYIAPLAVKAAADSNQCADAGAAWQVLKFYVGQGFRSTAEPTLKINTGAYDPLLGRSYFEIAMEGRSQHKTQEQGVLEIKGERFSGLNLIESKVSKIENERSVFDGIVTSIFGIPDVTKLPDDYLHFETLAVFESAKDALENFNAFNSDKTIEKLVVGLKAIGVARSALKSHIQEIRNVNRPPDFGRTARYENADYFFEQKENEFAEALRLAAGIQIDVLSDTETVAPDESVFITSRIYFPNPSKVKIKEVNLNAPETWQISKADAPKETNQGFFRREVANQTSYFNVRVPRDVKLTAPFWMGKTRRSDLFDLANSKTINESFQKSLLFAFIKIEIDGTEIAFDQPVEYRYADDVRGEIRRNLNVVPKISLSLDQNLLIVPQSGKSQTRKIVLSVTNNSLTPMNGEAKLNAPPEIKIAPATANFNLKNKGEKTSFAFDVTIPAEFKISDFELGAQATAGGETFTQTMNTIAYAHIQTHRFYTTAKTKVEVFDLKTAPVKIGYVAGSGDRVADAIRQMNFDVQMLGENDLTNGDLSKFDTIVVGIRASQVRPDFVANHQRLLDYVKNGGTLLVQYQLPVYQNLLPFPAQMGARVTDENAKVTILESASLIFNYPNKITERDFENWVQERNLYAFSTFDANYKPLLEAHDANEAENKGGLVVADIGKGKYIYCSYAFFRQLPAGVPGAYRLFANLLSVNKKSK